VVGVHIELRHLRYFLAVAEELNFSRAAERLHIAQPALSAQIRALEGQLGCELFSRTTRKVELTANGKMLLVDAREILRRTDETIAKLQALARGERGALRIGHAAHGAGEIGTEILRRFAEDFASVETELVNAASLKELQTQLIERETDVAFVWPPLLYDELTAETVLSERKHMVINREHPLARKRAVVCADFVDEPIVAPWDTYPPAFLAYWFGSMRPEGRRPDDPTAVSVEESLAFVSRGLAMYCVPESVSRFYARPDVVFRPIVDSPPVEVAVAWLRNATSPAVVSFVETTRAVLASEPGTLATIQSARS
jgi:DNA-binding transcriptional LysR family regulator